MATPPASPDRQPRRPPLLILVIVTALGPFALNILVPSMPGLQRSFDAGYDVVQLVLSLYLVGIAFGQLIYGPLSDCYGQRPLLLIGLGIFLVGTIGCIFASDIKMLVGFRILQAAALPLLLIMLGGASLAMVSHWLVVGTNRNI